MESPMQFIHQQSIGRKILSQCCGGIVCALSFIVVSLPALGQNEDSVTLDEVTVKVKRIEGKNDGWWIYPTAAQKQSSATGYSLLQKMSFPNIRVDETEHTVYAFDGRGSVQLRINDLIVGEAEMLALNLQDISKIDFIHQPGVRYGEGVAYVINILTRRAESGSSMGADLSHGLTRWRGDANLFGKWNTKRSEWALMGNTSYRKYRNDKLMEETAHYHLSDGSVRTIARDDFASRHTSCDNELKLNYNLMESEDFVFQTSFSAHFENTPKHWTQKNITDGAEQAVATEDETGHSWSPVLDVYFSKHLPRRQLLQFNAVGTYTDTDLSKSNDEGGLYRYDVQGKTYSLMSEGVYERRWKPFTFSSGFNYRQKYTQNEYTGSTVAFIEMHHRRLYLFSQLQGGWRKLQYSAGLGVSYLRYNQSSDRYDDWSFCPKLSLTYHLPKEWQVSYSFDCHDRLSRIAMISDAAIQNNPMEITMGSPLLQPSVDVENTLRISCNRSRWQISVDGFYRHCHHPNMALYERTEDDKFIYTQKNQKQISVLQAMLYANCWLVPEKLSLMAYGGLFRCFNYGDDYTHCHTSYFVSGSLNAYLGDFTLSASADNGFRFLEGETKGHNGGNLSLQTTYHHKNWQVSLDWQQPFVRRHLLFESDLLNRNLQKHKAMYSTGIGNYVGIHLYYRLNRGCKYQQPKRTLHLEDNDTGIIK